MRVKIAFFYGLIIATFFVGTSVSAFGQNVINGMVFNENRRPVGEIEVELLDEYERLLRTTKTRGSGLYEFSNIRQGVYYVKVRTAGTPFQEKSERIDLGSTNRTDQFGNIRGIEIIQFNVYLQIATRNGSEPNERTGMVFYQEVPKDAQKAYVEAQNASEKNDLARTEMYLVRAIGIFSDYFYALDKLGLIYANQGKYSESEGVLNRAVKVNARSFLTFYKLGTVQYKQKNYERALETFSKAVSLEPASISGNTMIGIVQRELRSYEEAEKSLLKASQLSNNKEPDIHWNLALLYYYNLNRYEEAAKQLELFLRGTPNAPAEKVAQVTKLIEKFRAKAKSSR